eukprot:281065_1
MAFLSELNQKLKHESKESVPHFNEDRFDPQISIGGISSCNVKSDTITIEKGYDENQGIGLTKWKIEEAKIIKYTFKINHCNKTSNNTSNIDNELYTDNIYIGMNGYKSKTQYNNWSSHSTSESKCYHLISDTGTTCNISGEPNDEDQEYDSDDSEQQQYNSCHKNGKCDNIKFGTGDMVQMVFDFNENYKISVKVNNNQWSVIKQGT